MIFHAKILVMNSEIDLLLVDIGTWEYLTSKQQG